MKKFTGLRQEMLAAGLVSPEHKRMDQSGIHGAMSTFELSAERILALRREAVRRFYIRPAYWWRRLCDLRSGHDFLNQLRDGLGVVWDALGLGAHK